jgi:hypothetical protein
LSTSGGYMTSSERAKEKRLLDVYKQTLEEHNAKRTEQLNACLLCRRPFSQFQPYQDHDHDCCYPKRKKANHFCGKCNRGLLCFVCNKFYVPAIEKMLRDNVDPKMVADYVLGWRKKIQAKGGYAPKESPKLRKAKKSVRPSSRSISTKPS